MVKLPIKSTITMTYSAMWWHRVLMSLHATALSTQHATQLASTSALVQPPIVQLHHVLPLLQWHLTLVKSTVMV